MTTPKLDILHIDPEFIIVNKPPGLLSVPGRGPEKQDCLASRMISVYPNTRIVHRLDQPTSGILICPQGYEPLRNIAKQFEAREVNKRYVAVVSGLVKDDEGSVELPLICDWPNRPRQMVDTANGKSALTHYTVLARDLQKNCTKVALKPVTGRSHQLRVHMLELGHPILGDTLYAPNKVIQQSSRLLLHATWIEFNHPTTGQKVEFDCKEKFEI